MESGGYFFPCHYNIELRLHSWRFFEAKHNDLFEWLLDNIDYPVRPRKRLEKAAWGQMAEVITKPHKLVVQFREL